MTTVYAQLLNNEPFYFFIATTREIRDTLDKIDRELFNFQRHLERLFRLFYSLLPKKSKLSKRLYETEQMFLEDLTKQFAKFVKTNGKYSLGIYTNIWKECIDNFFLYIKFFLVWKYFFV